MRHHNNRRFYALAQDQVLPFLEGVVSVDVETGLAPFAFVHAHLQKSMRVASTASFALIRVPLMSIRQTIAQKKMIAWPFQIQAESM